MSTSNQPTRQRLSAPERRELVLAAATHAFAQSGFAGTTTDAVAKEAGVSQPYVVRIFGTKLDLFLEVFDRASGKIRDAFAAVIAESFDPDSDEDWERLSRAYLDPIRDYDLLLVLMHGFMAGGQPEIGTVARHWMARIFALLVDAGATPDRTREFIAHGMLLNVLTAMQAPTHLTDNPELATLSECVYAPEDLAALRTR
ncbi:MAG: TetR/AcrR family transcriptional regulator [Actinomycetia bacterium]|nr:TetR/AcrR family transcriptional regulator [Actinomycetes bacterium]